MKKRLLSAALALAMVLTLLPVGAFAAVTNPASELLPSSATYKDSKGETKNIYVKNDKGVVTSTVNVSRADKDDEANGLSYGKWYWRDTHVTPNKYYEVTSGIVAGVNGSGQWYVDIGDYTNTAANGDEKVKGSFTILGVSSANLSAYKDTTLTVDIESTAGTALILPSTLTNLTVASKYLGTKGTVSSISTVRDAYGSANGLTVNATNVHIGSIDLKGRGNTLNLTNCQVDSGIKMDGATYTNATTTTPNAWNAQKLTAKQSTIIGGITITNGDNSTVSLEDTKGVSDISVTDCNGNNNSITVAGLSHVGSITTKPRTATGQWPGVTVTGGITDPITQTAMSGNSNSMSITIGVSGGNNTGVISVNSIVASKGTVNIYGNGDVKGQVKVDAGTLNISGSGVDIGGDVVLGALDTTTLSISATGSTFKGIEATGSNGAHLVINQWVGKRWTDGGNNYGELDLGNYTGKKVSGGTFSDTTDFADPSCMAWLDAYTTTGTSANLQFYVVRNSKFDLYSKTELARAISDIGNAAATKGNITVLGQGSSPKYITLMNGNVVWAEIGYNATTGIVLPTQINNVTISDWIGPNNAKVPAGKEEPIAPDAGGVILNATATSIGVNVKRITKARPAQLGTPGNEVNNQSINVTMNGNNISLTGAANPGVGGWATVYIDLETDVVDTAGDPIVLEKVVVEYNPTTRAVVFSTYQPTELRNKYGVIVQDGALVLNMGTGERYTVSANLSVSASDLGLYNTSQEIQVTLGGNLSRMTELQQREIKKYFTNGTFNINGNQPILVAINAAQATITSNSSVAGWVTNAKNTIWRNGLKDANGQYITLTEGNNSQLVPHTGNNIDISTTAGQDIARSFGKAYLVPYLVVNVTAFDRISGTLTATLTPYYRVDVSSTTGYKPGAAYTVQPGRALSVASNSLDSNNPVKVKFAVTGTSFDTQYMHQDGKYVYQATAQEWSISHTGTNGTLGTIVINNIKGPIKLESGNSARNPSVPSGGWFYDTLQAAIDDTVPGRTVLNDANAGYNISSDTALAQGMMDVITIDGTYTGSCDITMTGLARRVLVVANGQQAVKSTSSNVSVQNSIGFSYIVELKQDTVTTVPGNITVTDVTGGTASVNVNPATVGQTVTITLRPNTGYTSNGVTVRTVATTGVASVVVPVSGSGNSYTFTMPSGSVTVTPAFRQNQTQANATVTVSSPSTGSAVTSALNNQVTPGSVVTVTTYPGAGQRTMGLSISTNGGSATAVRTGVNTFQFTVPTNATSVVVTPTFDVNNNTVFSDVWSKEYYSNPVAWAVSSGITDGTSTYTFSPSNYCTRAQMVTFLWRAAGRPSVANIRNPFVDVSPTLTPGDYYSAILWAVSKGITDGVDSTHFGPSQQVTRAQAVTFLYRFENKPAAGSNSGFYDVPSSQWYAKAVSWAANRSVPITTGVTPTTFVPGRAVTRAEAVTFLYRDRTNKLA